jgi:hypothetical protein
MKHDQGAKSISPQARRDKSDLSLKQMNQNKKSSSGLPGELFSYIK